MATIKDWTLGILIKAKDEATGVFAGVTGALKGMAVAAAAYAGFDLFRDAISGAADFEAAMDKVVAKTDDGRQNAAKLADAARRIGPEFGASATEAAQGLEILGAAGLKADDAIKTLPAVLALAKAEGIGLEQAAGLVTDSLSIMGLGFDQAGRAADVLVKGANLSNTSATDLGEALKYVGGEAVAAGLTLEKTTALLDALAAQGFKAGQGGTSLRQALSDLINPTSKAREELLKLGVTTGDVDAALIAIKAAGAGGEAAIRAFGIEGGAAIRKLIAELPNIAGYEKGILGAGNAAKTAAEQVGGNLTGAINALSAIWQVVSQQLLEPVLEPLANGLRNLAANLREFAKDGLGGLQASVAAVATTFSEVASTIGEVFTAGFAKAREAWTAFQDNLNLGTASGALDGLRTAFAAVVTFITENLPTASEVGAAAANAISIGWNAVATAIYGAGAAIAAVTAGIVSAFGTVENALVSLGVISEENRDRLKSVAEGMAAAAEELGKKSVESYDSAREAAVRLLEVSQTTAETQKKAAAEVQEANQKTADSIKQVADAQQAAAEAAQQAATAQTQADQQVLDKKTQILNATKETVERLKQEYEALKASGTASAVEISLAFTKLQTAQRYLSQQTGETSKEIVAAFERLGVESAKSLRAVADSAKTDFQTIKQSGTASVGELNAAFAAMAAKALEAAAAVSPLAIEIEKNKLSILAGTTAQREALAELVQKYQEVKKTAADAGATQKKAAEETAAVVDKTTDAIAQQAAAADKAAKSMEGVRLATVKVGSEMAVAFGDQLPRYNSLVSQIKQWMEGAADAATALSAAVQAGSVADYGPLLFAAREMEGSFQSSSGYMDATVARIRDDLVKAIQDATAAMREFANEQARAAEEETLDLERQQAAGDERRLAEIDHREKLIELQKLLSEAEAITDTAARLRAIDAVQERIRLENERHALVIKNIQSEEAAQRGQSNQPNSPQRSERTVRFRLQTDKGESIINTDQSGANALDEFFASLDTARRRAA